MVHIWGGRLCRRKTSLAINQNRKSGIELLRILAMLTIIAHHMVVSSGIVYYPDGSGVTAKIVFLQLWSMWGKTAINCYVMITGYFMCTSKLTLKRYLKIFLEAKFYRILSYFVFAFAGYEILSGLEIFKTLFSYIREGNGEFIASFLIFYLFIPFLNMVIDRFDRRSLKALILLLLFMFTVKATLLFNAEIYHDVFWYMTVYLIAAYIRLYPPAWSENRRLVTVSLIAVIVLSYLSVVFLLYVGDRFWFLDTFHMVIDSHKLFALLVGVLAFLFFRDLDLPYVRAINTAAATTFGVLCIHAITEGVRIFLWRDLLKIPEVVTRPLPYVIGFFILADLGVFAVCSLLDLLRIRFLERPVFAWITKHEDALNSKLDGLLDKVLK